MKNVLRLFASLAGFLNPRQIVRKCPVLLFYRPTFPEPIRGNPKLRAETCASGPGVENPNGNTGLNGPVQHPSTPPNRCTVLQCVAPCCTQKFLRPQVQYLHFPDRAGRCMVVLPGCAQFRSPGDWMLGDWSLFCYF